MKSRWLHRFAVFTAISTLLLIFVGGLVTSTGSGLAVPDWPLSFGKVFPEMKGGVAYEHGHRMAATLVGFFTVILAIWIWKQERRKTVRMLGLLAVVAVITQGILGGTTVLLRLPVFLSVAHAAVAQIFLCLTVAIAIHTSEKWQQEKVSIEDRGTFPIRRLAVHVTAIVYLQIIFGAMMRHTGGGLSIPDFPLSYGRLAPPFFTGPIFFNYAHRIIGLAVILLVVWFFIRTLGMAASDGTLRAAAFLMISSLTLQVILGAVTIWSRKAPIPTTLHVFFGALTLAACLWLTMDLHGRLSPHPAVHRGVHVTTA